MRVAVDRLRAGDGWVEPRDGFFSSSPREAWSRTARATARARERETASADRACDRSTAVREVQTRAKRAAVRAVSAADQAAMVRLGRLRTLAADRARALVARKGSGRGM